MNPTKNVLLLISLFLITFCNAQNQNTSSISLKQAFKDYFFIGTCVNRRQVTGKDEKAEVLIKDQFNSITAENDLKWEKIHPQEGEYNFEPGDAFVAFGEENNMMLIGHTLVWHSQTPQWVYQDDNGNELSKEALLARLKDHIFKVVGHFKGKIHGWDVVNEAFNDDGTYRQTKYYTITQGEYLEKAFAWAHEADPDAELYYNDFNMWYEGKRKAVVDMVKRFKEKGITINAIGMQGHWGLDYPPLDEVEASIKAYAATGLKVNITELDMRVLPDPGGKTGAEIERNYALKKALNPYVDGLPDSVQEKITKRWVEFFTIFKKYKDFIDRITIWGSDDRVSWRNNWPVPGRTSYPLLFNRDLSPKPAVQAIMQLTMGIPQNMNIIK